MKREYADGAATLLVGVTLFSGGYATWQAYRQWTALSDVTHMGTSMAAMHGTHPVWYLLGTILGAAVIGGVYLGVRDRIVSSSNSQGKATEHDIDSADPRASQSESIAEGNSTRQVLDLLPEDERRILQPVIESPGLTQIELRDRSDFSKSKVSQTVTDLEKRGLLYREPQGRTYRVYPSDELERGTESSLAE
ncbi:MarR family transcriptional regulator [Natronolimnohabitans sp. A-GB9]|uniref:helix-turn-helix transcriptional regulator n=1 Tax=Natronolimnohabitans sp. A-GB9 TaxID=3069757 RepID=UPI0027B5549C|nr:MarR family transcriptional regulator [Natronolimnohabitans sp. A-GB9]MDQ2051699.1 MarR family transcriptional regulator [Natronolimnohabitans sp. A-GB9]